MKYCTKCGQEIDENAAFCPVCGAPTNVNQNQNANTNQQQQETTLQTVAKVFMIISTVLYGFTLFPLIWMVPMTVSYCKKIKNHEPVSLGFKICSLIFVNPVAGILMICDDIK